MHSMATFTPSATPTSLQSHGPTTRNLVPWPRIYHDILSHKSFLASASLLPLPLLVVIDEEVAFLGGIDLCYNRYEDSRYLIADHDGFIFPGRCRPILIGNHAALNI